LKLKFTTSASFVVGSVNRRRSVALLLVDQGVRVPAGNVTIPANADVPQPGDVVEVRYLYAFPESGHVFQPVFLGVRDDVLPDECTVSQLKFKADAVPA
jgi:bifunctional non-homologous end joining protein LigD